MRVLVTGVSGFSGSHMARGLAARNIDVVGVYRRNPGFADSLTEIPNLRLIQADLAAPITFQGPFDAIVHIAATSPGPGITAAQIKNDNVTATQMLIEAAERFQCRRFIYFSSLSVYGDIAGSMVDENTPIVNPDVYGSTKFMGEEMLSERADTIATVAFRLPGVIGPGARRNWLSTIAPRLRAGEVLTVYNPDGQFNNAVHVADLEKLVTALLERDWIGFDAIVLGARGMLTIRETVERLARGLGVTTQIAPIASPKTSFTLSSDRAIAQWGYDPMEIGAMIDRYATEA